MALRLRRGTDAERLLITPQEGELIYVTDTKKLFVGDGATLGGVAVDTIGDPSFSLDDLTDVNTLTNPPNLNQALIWNGSQWVPGSISQDGSGVVDGSNYRINIISDDSTVMVETETATLRGNLQGDVIGNVVGDLFGDVTGTLTGEVDGSLRGNVFGDAYGDHYGDKFNGRLINFDSSVAYNGNGDFFGNLTGNLVGDVTGDLTGNVTGDLTGDVTGNLLGNVVGSLNGDVTGSVFADDSSVIVDGTSGQIVGSINSTFGIETITTETPFTATAVTTGNPGPRFVYQSSRGTLEAPTIVEQGDSLVDLQGSGYDGTQYTVGSYIKLAVDNNVTVSNGIVPGRVVLGTFNASGNTGLSNVAIWSHTGRLGLSVIEPTEKLDVDGNGKFSGSVVASSFDGDLIGSIFTDGSTRILDGTSGEFYSANIDVVGETGNTPSVGSGDLLNVNEWLEISVNGNTRYIPLYV